MAQRVFQGGGVFQGSDDPTGFGVFQGTHDRPDCGFGSRYPFYWAGGGGVTSIYHNVTSVLEHSLHPINAVMAMGELSDTKKVESEWFGAPNKVKTDRQVKAIPASQIPKAWRR